MTAVVNVSGNEFTGSAQQDGTAINACLKGTADYAALDAVEMLLRRIHAEADRLGIAETVIDLRQLEFMNSSCFKSFVSWLNDIQAMDQDRQYRVRFVSNPNHHWQKRSLNTLRCFATELVSVTEHQ